MNTIRHWFERLEAREKKLVLVAAAFVLIAIIYFLLWQPLLSRAGRVERTLQSEKANLTWMRMNVPEILRLRGSKIGANGDISSMVNDAAVANALAMKSFQPKGDSEAQVVFEKASFNKVLAWMHTMEQRNGFILTKVTITGTGENNIVDARINLSKGI